jgi:ubiquinone/menaquinone biosynthesis C-methylase UbiE
MFSAKTHEVVLSFVKSSLQQVAGKQERSPRILDVGCGTGILLASIASMYPDADLYGIDASQSMLRQAAHQLRDNSQVHLSRASLPEKAGAGFSFPPAFFDVITCANTLHYAVNLPVVLQDLMHILAPTGQIVMEDYILRGPAFSQKILEKLIKIYDPQHVRLYTNSMMQEICQQIGFQVLDAQNFPIDLFCNGWGLLLKKAEAPE